MNDGVDFLDEGFNGIQPGEVWAPCFTPQKSYQWASMDQQFADGEEITMSTADMFANVACFDLSIDKPKFHEIPCAV